LIVPTDILLGVYLDEHQRVQRTEVTRHIVMP
jgi:hypothetical protein